VVKEAGVPGENRRPWASNWSTLSLAVASRVHPFCNLQSRVRTNAVLVIGLYELLGNPTSKLISNSCNYGTLCENGHYFFLQKTQCFPKKNQHNHTHLLKYSFFYLVPTHVFSYIYMHAIFLFICACLAYCKWRSQW
jgi:hypothetical protein